MGRILSRRRFVAGAITWTGISTMLEGCGNGAGGQPVTTTPIPALPSSPVSFPTPSPAPPPAATMLKIAVAGSSSAEQYLSFYTGPASNAAVQAASDGNGFVTLETGAFGKTAGVAINQALNRPVCFIRGGIGGSKLKDWAAANSSQRATLVRSIKAAGGADVILIQIGRNDAADQVIVDTATQTALLRALINAVRNEANVPNAIIFIGGTQDLINGTRAQYVQFAMQRQAEMAVVNDAGVRYGFSTYDLDTFDGIHQSEASQIVSGTRFAAQVIAWAKASVEQRGPRIVNVRSISSTETHLTLVHGAGSDFTPSMKIDGFVVAVGTEEYKILSAERVDATTVRLSHQATGSETPVVSYALLLDTSNTACLRDTSVYGLPMEPYASRVF